MKLTKAQIELVEKVVKAKKYTGWYVLLKKVNGRWKSLGCITDIHEDYPEDWDIILPIPKPETLKEWDGF